MRRLMGQHAVIAPGQPLTVPFEFNEANLFFRLT